MFIMVNMVLINIPCSSKRPLRLFHMVNMVLTYFSRASWIQIRKGSIEHIDEWMTCDFTSFSTVFQSYQGDVWMIMKGCVQRNSIYS